MGKKIAQQAAVPHMGWEPPIIFDAQNPSDRGKLVEMLEKDPTIVVYDQIHLAISDLFDVEFPEKKDTKTDTEIEQYSRHFAEGNLDNYGSWVFFPWSRSLIHFPTKDDLRKLRTSRNRNLITSIEQRKLYSSTICIAGMSVGSNVVEALLSGGIGGKLILVDMDYLEPSNLNRIRAPFHHLGLHKVDAIARKVSEADPYIEQVHYLDGLTEDSLDEVIRLHHPDVFVDEMDDVRMKLKARLMAKPAGIPVIMAADDGDGVLIDIERFDKNREAPILHGLVPDDVIDRILGPDSPSRKELGFLIGKYFVGFENTPLRMFESLAEVGKTLPSWPQLGGAAALAGVTLAYAAKRIINDQPLSAGRHLFTPDEKLNPEINSKAYQDKLADIIKMLDRATTG
jgi:molybdopterin/thiamine biosynthesis adenylyltransferase